MNRTFDKPNSPSSEGHSCLTTRHIVKPVRGSGLNDLVESSDRDAPFRITPTGQALLPEEVAFIGESVCDIRTVKVGDLSGTWIYSEFETDAPFEAVARWVDPQQWPELAPVMFKKVELVGADVPLAIPGGGSQHWHGVFHEEVQLVRTINTLLHCDHWRDGQRATGMTFDLAFSSDGQLDIDRGFILVNEVDDGANPVRRVQALKIVGFTDDYWDAWARASCPYWTEFLRGAVKGSSTAPKPTQPSPERSGSASPSLDDSTDAWIRFFGASAKTYLDLFDDINARATSGEYSTSDWLKDGTRFWSRLAKDWVRAWSYGLDVLRQVSQDESMPNDILPPSDHAGAPVASRAINAASPGGLDEMTLSVPGVAAGDHPVCSDLKSIEGPPATIAGANVSVSVIDLTSTTPDVRLKLLDFSAPPGLYVGELLRKLGGEVLTPVQFYVSGATGG
jgi:hypothetical protein